MFDRAQSHPHRTARIWRMLLVLALLAVVVAPMAATAAPEDQSRVYVVQRGDTLSKIAVRFGVTQSALVKANGIRNPDFVYVGQRLVIPTGGTSGKPANPGPVPTAKPSAGRSGRWIDVNLSRQTITAFEGQRPVFTTKVSTGLPRTPTVVGTYKVYVKLVSTRMTGPGYDLPNVPYTMYFYRGYAIHGAYWHNNFGHPMSHGCVNVSTQDAAWLFGFASVGTTVVTHY